MRRRHLIGAILAIFAGVAGSGSAIAAVAPAAATRAAGDRISSTRETAGPATATPPADSATTTVIAPDTATASMIAADTATTTVIVVRHAEKAAGEGDDPHLSDAGEARAEALAHALERAGVTAVITTQFVRTGETAAPTAREAGVKPEVVPVEWDSLSRHARAVAAAVMRHPGGVVLVVGHSNTLPTIVAALGGTKPDAICDAEYDRMEIVTVAGGRARVIESRYGDPTPVEAGCASMK